MAGAPFRPGTVVSFDRPATVVLRGERGPAGPAGEPGPCGATGPAGATGARGADGVGAPFSVAFPDPLGTWIVNHNLGRAPVGVTVSTVGGVEIMADVQNVSPNQTRVYFDAPTAGVFACI